MRRFVALVSLVAAAAGCAPLRSQVAYENPILLPAVDREVLWNHVVDVVDDYFRIKEEQRVRLQDNILIEGRIDTYPELGATLFEPWRRDSVPGYERWLATLQTIRRQAVVRVIPVADGYLVDVTVYKELENVRRPDHATAGAATFRHDNSIQRYDVPVLGQPVNQGWIPLGRDTELEQEMIGKLQSCFAGGPARVVPVPAQIPSEQIPPGVIHSPNEPLPLLPSLRDKH